MGTGYLIDTNSVIDFLDNRLPEIANNLIEKVKSQISIITRMELLSWSNINEQQLSILTSFIEDSIVFSLDEPVILKTIEIRKSYKTKLPDAIIAATAIVHSLILITRNVKDFTGIEGLQIVNPFEMERDSGLHL